MLTSKRRRIILCHRVSYSNKEHGAHKFSHVSVSFYTWQVIFSSATLCPYWCLQCIFSLTWTPRVSSNRLGCIYAWTSLAAISNRNSFSLLLDLPCYPRWYPILMVISFFNRIRDSRKRRELNVVHNKWSLDFFCVVLNTDRSCNHDTERERKPQFRLDLSLQSVEIIE